MTTIAERVARAIRNASVANQGIEPLPHAALTPNERKAYEPIALAALTEIQRTHAIVPMEVIEFLRGSAPLDGVWFGDKHPTEKGAFWWRRRLAAPAIGEGKGE